jgi:aminopeptidase N
MFPDNLTRTEAQARSALISVHAYQVVVDVSGRDVAEPGTWFISASTIRFRARQAGELHADLIAESVEQGTLDGCALDPGTFAASRLPLRVDAGDHELTVRARCRFSHSGEGLHRFVDPADDRTYLYTQFEAAEARRVYACFEQPDLKARFSISVIAPDGWTVASCGRVLQVSAAGPGVSRWDFAETAPISTYLTAVVAGDYDRVGSPYLRPAGEIDMALLCRRSLTEHLDGERIRRTTIAGFDVFEDRFGYPYPFGKYDQVFVPEYNGGAMENVGCVTLRDEYLFRGRVTAASCELRDDTILHELSHMWFGDLVTMRWWDDLWLKESFATWASNFARAELGDADQVWAAFCHDMKTWAYRQDQLPSTHPIAADMVDLEAVELNFDGITYAKGASVLVQLVAFVGPAAFLAGLRDYFSRHAFGNTELADLLHALESASGRDLSGWSAQWLESAGVNTLQPRFTVAPDGTFGTFAIGQSADDRWPTLRDHRLTVGLYSLGDAGLVRTRRVEIDVRGAETAVPGLVGCSVPDLVLVNDDDLSYAKVRLDPRSLGTLVEQIHLMPSALARAVCWGAAWDMCRDAEMPPADYVRLALQGVGTESDLTAVENILAGGLTAAADYTPRAGREEVLGEWHGGLGRLLAAAEPGSDHQLALARAYAAAAGDEVTARVLSGWLSGHDVPAGLAVDHELRWRILRHLARLGHLDDDAIAAEEADDHTITGAEQAAGARAARPTAAAKAAAWAAVADTDTLPNATQRVVCRSFWQRGQDAVLAPYVDLYFRLCEDISAGRGGWAEKGTALRTTALRDLFPRPADVGDLLARLDAWLAHARLDAYVARVIGERRDEALRTLRCQQAGARGR